MDMNWLVILGISIVAMIMAMIWFWPLFGKLWAKIHGWEHMSKSELKKQEEWMWKLLLLEAISTFVMIGVLSFFIQNLSGYSPFVIALLIWIWFNVPNNISWVIWGADKKKWQSTKIIILAGFNLVVLLLSAYLLTLFS